jgi:hypothetical protein
VVALATTWKGRQDALPRLMGYIGEGHDQYYGNKSFHHLDIGRFRHKKVLSGPRVFDKSNGVRTFIGAYMSSYLSDPSRFSLYCPGSEPVIFKRMRCSMYTYLTSA